MYRSVQFWLASYMLLRESWCRMDLIDVITVSVHVENSDKYGCQIELAKNTWPTNSGIKTARKDRSMCAERRNILKKLLIESTMTVKVVHLTMMMKKRQPSAIEV
mmetsp:Transcript_83823/g.233831  ORF Transcript_83823/g.233831 Transcript_83823/m.233831 type:complete len:105 (+) Transcript_83823:371-685(+)